MQRDEIRDRLGNVDQIKDILFGAQMREYDNRFTHVESELALLHQDLQDRIDDVKTSLANQIQSAIETLEKRLKTMSSNLQEETADLRQQHDRLTRKFQGNLDELDQALERKTAALNQDFSEARLKLQEDIRNLRTQIFEELESRFDSVQDTKLAREEMAAALFELGMRLKGQDMLPALQAVADDRTSVDVEVLLPEGR